MPSAILATPLHKTCKKCQHVFEGKYCKPCAAQTRAAWKRANHEKVKAQKRAYYSRNKEAIAERARIYRQENKELINSISAAYRRDQKDRVLALKRAYRQANAKRLNAAAAQAYKEDPTAKREQRRRWLEKNPEAIKRHSHNRRAKMVGAGGRLSVGLAARLFELQRGKCACCGEALGSDYHLDHVMPLALGGTNTDSNMQLLRSICNQQKHAKHPVDFMQERGFLL